MRARGYSEELATGLIAAGGTLGILIPPSLTLILYGLAAEQSIGKLFMAGVGPGLLLTAMFVAWTVFQYRRDRLRATLAAAAGGPALRRRSSASPGPSGWRRCRASLPFLVVIVLIMVALYGGWATPSEVAGIGAFVVAADGGADLPLLPLAGHEGDPGRHGARIVHGDDDHRDELPLHLRDELPAHHAERRRVAGALPLSKWVFFFWVNVLLIVLGFFLPPVAIILMVTPILLPALKAHGFDLIWFGVIMTILMEMGLIHPPVGLNLFVINSIAPDIPLSEDRLGRAAVPRADGDRDRPALRVPRDRDLPAGPLPGQVGAAAAPTRRADGSGRSRAHPGEG